ncbi:MAG: hypothetical protein AMXMBFR13_03050 [Phycisphaerae bacterium]
MSEMDRREFLGRTAAAVGTTLGLPAFAAEKPGNRPAGAAAAATRPAGRKILRANDQIVLGKTGIKTSRLAIGTGSKGGSEQHKAGKESMIKLLRGAVDEGVRWWDVADSYKTHPYAHDTLKELKRDQVVITTKTGKKDAAGVKADLERFRNELGTDYIDIVLLHCMMDDQWPEKMRGPMDVLSEAKQKGWVRAVGVSCHTFGALQAAANEPWVEVDLARFNPFGKLMDETAPGQVDVHKVAEVLETMHRRGKVVYGMKILGEGQIKGDQIDESLRFALSKPYISGFTIGFSKPEQIADISRRMKAIRATG